MQFLIETQRAENPTERGRQVAVVETLTDVRAIAAELAGQDAQGLVSSSGSRRRSRASSRASGASFGSAPRAEGSCCPATGG